MWLSDLGQHHVTAEGPTLAQPGGAARKSGRNGVEVVNWRR